MNRLKRPYKKAIAVLAVPVVSAIVSIVSAPCAFAQAGGTRMLKGTVEHSEQLAPVQGQVGSVFDRAAQLQSVPPKTAWYRVPAWLAGSWQADSSTQTSYTDYKTNTTNSNVVTSSLHAISSFGLQRDRVGGVWGINNVPYLADFSAEDNEYKDLHTDDSVMLDEGNRFVMRISTTRTTIAKSTNTITSINQTEFIVSYSLVGPQSIRSETSAKVFDQQGKAVASIEAWAMLHQIAPFKVSNYAASEDVQSEDVRPLFRAYLIDHGLANLVPQE